MGLKTVPCGTPAITDAGADLSLSTKMAGLFPIAKPSLNPLVDCALYAVEA